MSWYINAQLAQKAKEEAAKKQQATKQPTQTKQTAATTTTKPASPLPSEKPPVYVKDNGSLYVRSDYKAEPVKENNQVIGYELTPKPQTDPVDVALAQAKIREQAGLRSNVQQGTKTTLPTTEQITQNLSPEQKKEYVSIVQAEQRERITNLGLFIGSGVAAPVIGPVASVEAVGLGLGVSQGIKTGVTLYQGRQLQESLLTPTEAFQAATSSLILSGGFTVGARAYGVLAPKVNVAAESVLARSTRIAEGGLNRISPGLGKASSVVVSRDTERAAAFLSSKDAALSSKVASKIVNPVKYGVGNKAANFTFSLKDNVITAGQRASDIIGPRGASEPAAFMRGVAKPNLLGYSKVAKTTALYAKTEAGISRVKGLNVNLANENLIAAGRKGISTIRENPIYTADLFERSVRLPNLKPSVSTGESLGSALKIEADLVKAKFPSVKIKASVPKSGLGKSSVAQEAKAIGKVAAGKTRQTLNLKTPEDKILPSERTPLKFSAPKDESAQIKQLVQRNAKAVQAFEIKGASKLTSGGVSKAVLPYPGTAVRAKEVEETQYLTYPNKPLTVPKVSVSLTSKTAFTTKESLKITPSIKTSTKTTNLFTPTVGPNISSRIDNGVSSVPAQAIRPSQQVKFAPVTGIKPITVAAPKINPFPNFPVGGGSGGIGGSASFSGKWAKRNTRIKTADEMFKTFGFKLPKGTTKAIKKVNAFDRRVADVGLGKAYKPKASKTKGRRKRKR